MSTARQLDLPMPSEEERQYVGAGNFKEIGDDFLQLFTRLGHLKPSDDVLDVGCGDGALLEYLRLAKKVDGRGIELSPIGVNKSVAKGLSVIQGNAEKEIAHFRILLQV